MRGAVVWTVVGVVLGGAGVGAQEPAPAAADREAMERTLAAMRDLGTVWLSWLGEGLMAEDFGRPEWLETPAGVVPPRIDPSGLPDPEDREAVDEWAAKMLAEAEAKRAWEEGREHRVEWPGYYDLERLPVRFTAAELEAVLRELLPPEEVDGLVWEDGWGRPFELRFSGHVLERQVMAIRSGGRDGAASATMYRIGSVPPDPDGDILWADGFFVRWPEGVTIQE